MDLDLRADGDVDPAAARELLVGILDASTEYSGSAPTSTHGR
jgi:hypothetical protein